MTSQSEKQRGNYDQHQDSAASTKRRNLEHYRIECSSVVSTYPPKHSFIESLSLPRHYGLGEFSKSPGRYAGDNHSDNEKYSEAAEQSASALDCASETARDRFRSDAKVGVMLLCFGH
jgi:hypothetical protein